MNEHGIDAPSLEGYLFPDTYRFPPDATSRDVIRRMTAHFEEMTATFLPRRNGRERNPHVMHEYVILASIVEREANSPRTTPYFRRVSQPAGKENSARRRPDHPVCAQKFNGPLFASELAMDTPYNTRPHAGLPPGPICSPGLASLAAAMSPEQTKDLYFVAKWDGSGAHDFSMTNEEHTRKKNEIRRMNDLRKAASARLAKEKK